MRIDFVKALFVDDLIIFRIIRGSRRRVSVQISLSCRSENPFHELFTTWKKKNIFSTSHACHVKREETACCPRPDRVYPCDVCGHTGEDGGLLDSVASHARHKTGYSMDIPIVANFAAERATKVPLGGNKTRVLWFTLTIGMSWVFIHTILACFES